MDETTKKTLLSAAASVAATAIVVRTVASEIVPYDLQEYLSSSLSSLLARLSSQLTVSVDEHDGLVPNQMYRHAESYLSDRLPPSARRLRIRSDDDSDALHVAMHPDEEVVDRFRGVKFTWRLVSRAGADPASSSSRRRRPHPTYSNRTYETAAFPASGSKTLELRFPRKHRELALRHYFPHVIERARGIREERRAVKLHTNEDEYSWTTVGLRHPATFATLAMDAAAKREVVEDLERFVGRKEYYRRVGKAWKRGYLLYGPPGTGKSSLVAAMANFLRFDVYDLELSNVSSNSQLRSLLAKTASRSILVVEDIDCSVRFGPRDDPERGEDDEKVTLSGLLNCVDGLWSSCGDEKIIVFTTNHKDRLDPALLRPGRMDVHVHMSYCTPCGFRVLASNYLAIDNHPLFHVIEETIREINITPAEVAEELMKSDDADAALEGLVKFMKHKKSSSN